MMPQFRLSFPSPSSLRSTFNLPGLVSAAVLAAGLLASGSSWAADRTVGSGKTYSTVKDAIKYAAAGDRILIYAGTYTGNLVVSKKLELKGMESGVIITASSGTVLGFLNNNASGSKVSNLTVSGGASPTGATIRVYRSSASFSGITVTNGAATSSGGGLLCSESTCYVENSTFSNNLSYGTGGAIASYRSTMELKNSSIVNNDSTGKGAGFYASASSLLISGNLFEGNDSSSESGGGVSITDSSDFELLDNTFRWNTSGQMGAGFHAINDTGVATGNLIEENTSATDAGGMVVQHSDVDVIGNVIRGNHCAWAAGGLYVLDAEGGMVRNNVVYANSTDQVGGGIVVETGTGDIYNNIVAYNESALGGGGILAVNGAVGARIVNNTVYDNTAGGDFSAGIAALSGSDLYAVNNISVMNVQGGMYAEDDAPLVDVRYNDSWASDEDGFTNYAGSADSAEGVSGNVAVDPVFRILNTTYDVEDDDPRLQAGSPLVNTGDPSILDTDGSRSDMGAFGGPWGNSWDDLPVNFIW